MDASTLSTPTASKKTEKPKDVDDVPKMKAKIQQLSGQTKTLQSQNEALKNQNEVLFTQVLILSKAQLQINAFLITPTLRIKKTNEVVRNIMQNIRKYDVVKDLISEQTQTITSIQATLTDIVAKWSTAGTELEMYHPSVNSNPLSLSLPRARPVFQMKNLLAFLTSNAPFKVKKNLSTLIWKYDITISKDISAFIHLRPDYKYPTLWEAYLAMVATVLVWNIYKDNPVRYLHTAGQDYHVDYENHDSYMLAVLGNEDDLDIKGVCPTVDQCEDTLSVVVINPSQPPAPKARKRHHQ